MNEFHALSRSRRGVSLLWVMIMLPAMLMGFLAIVTRLQTTQREARRGQERAQARLLAESALFVFQDALRARGASAPQGPALPSGEIKGRGTYQIAWDGAGAAGRRLKARGAVAGREGRMICEIAASLEPTTQTAPAAAGTTLRVLDLRYRVEPLK